MPRVNCPNGIDMPHQFKYLSGGNGLRFSTEVYGSNREKTVFHEYIQKCFVLTELSGNLRDFIGARRGESGWDAEVGLAAFTLLQPRACNRRTSSKSGCRAVCFSSHKRMQSFKLRVSNPRAVVDSYIKVPSEGSNLPGAGPISFQIEQTINKQSRTKITNK